METLLHDFTHDPGIRLAALLVALDLLLGVCAALRANTFRLGWLPDFLRRDVLGKLVPYFGVWAAVRLGGDIEIAGVGAIEETVNGAIVLALGASILNSLRDLGLLRGAPDVVAGSDTPPPAP